MSVLTTYYKADGSKHFHSTVWVCGLLLVADKAVTMVMSDEASQVRRVIYLQRDRERAVYAADRGEHSEKVKQRKAKNIYLYKEENFSRAVFKRSHKATVTQRAKYNIHIHLWIQFIKSNFILSLKSLLMIYSDVREAKNHLISTIPSTICPLPI